MSIFDSSSDDVQNGIILEQKIPYYNLDCLQMAVEAGCLNFISLSSVQNLLTDIWNGKVLDRSGFKANFKVSLVIILGISFYLALFFNYNLCLKFVLSCFSFGILAPFLLFEKSTKLTKVIFQQMHT